MNRKLWESAGLMLLLAFVVFMTLMAMCLVGCTPTAPSGRDKVQPVPTTHP